MLRSEGAGGRVDLKGLLSTSFSEHHAIKGKARKAPANGWGFFFVLQITYSCACSTSPGCTACGARIFTPACSLLILIEVSVLFFSWVAFALNVTR